MCSLFVISSVRCDMICDLYSSSLPLDMDGGLLNDLEFFPPTDKPASSVAVAGIASNCPGLGIYQNEESVDFSSWILEACNEVPVVSAPSPLAQRNYHEAPGVAHVCSDAFSFRNYCTPPPVTSNSTINMYDSTNTAPRSSSTELSAANLPPSHTTLSEPGPFVMSELPGSRPAPGKAAKKSKKKVLDKNTQEYKEKRERNNIAVRKSREKNRHQVLETQRRVKDLEEENAKLQSKIALLSKELKVLKDLFASAGVSQPPSMCIKSEHGGN